MKTEQEIRERIATHQATLDGEAEGGMDNEEWEDAVVAKHELLWVLGERES